MNPYPIGPTYAKLMFAPFHVKTRTSVLGFAADGLDMKLLKHFAPHKLRTTSQTEQSNTE